MANKKILWGMSAVALVFALALIGCATTTQITFAPGTPLPEYHSETPVGEFRYAVITATIMGGDSVLQRFYAEYSREKYQVVSCELVSKNWLPVVATMGGALLGAAIGIPIAAESEDLASGMGVGFGVPLMFGSLGSLIGTYFKDSYVVTYVER